MESGRVDGDRTEAEQAGVTPQLLRVGAVGALLAAFGFVAVTAYLFGFLGARGFTPDMFDDNALLHRWVADNTAAYRAVWLLVVATQVCLLPAPYSTTRLTGAGPRSKAWVGVAAVFGTVGMALAVISPIIFLATSGPLAEAFVAAPSPVEQEQVLVTTVALAELAKFLRLVAEVLLAVWLVVSGLQFGAQFRFAGRLVGLIGWLTAAVALHKIWYPQSPFEDFWGLALAVAYATMAVVLWRQAAVD
jgi:hypothetical protein